MRVLVTGAGDYLGRRLLEALRQILPPGQPHPRHRAGPATAPRRRDAPRRRSVRCRQPRRGGRGVRSDHRLPSRGPGLGGAVERVTVLRVAGGPARHPEPRRSGGADPRDPRVPQFDRGLRGGVPGPRRGRTSVSRRGPTPSPDGPRTPASTSCATCWRMPGCRHLVLRPSNYIGPGQSETFVVASLAGQIARIERGLAPPNLAVGDLSAGRDFFDVADFTAACLRVIERIDDLPDGGIFNVGSGVVTPVSEILDALLRMTEATVHAAGRARAAPAGRARAARAAIPGPSRPRPAGRRRSRWRRAWRRSWPRPGRGLG